MTKLFLKNIPTWNLLPYSHGTNSNKNTTLIEMGRGKKCALVSTICLLALCIIILNWPTALLSLGLFQWVTLFFSGYVLGMEYLGELRMGPSLYFIWACSMGPTYMQNNVG